MAIEIERKFLVKNDTYKEGIIPKYFRQGYLCVDEERVVRVRVADERAFITIKGKNNGISRIEYEYEIPKDEAVEMLDKLALPGVIEKYRYCVSFASKLWEVDEFLGNNAGLVLAEIELKNADESFEIPDWLAEEVSHDARYYNSNLSKKPYNQW